MIICTSPYKRLVASRISLTLDIATIDASIKDLE